MTDNNSLFPTQPVRTLEEFVKREIGNQSQNPSTKLTIKIKTPEKSPSPEIKKPERSDPLSDFSTPDGFNELCPNWDIRSFEKRYPATTSQYP